MIKGQLELYDEKEKLRTYIKNEIEQYSISKIPLKLSVSGVCGTPLKVSVVTPNTSFEILSGVNLADVGTEALNHKMVLKD